MATTSEFDSTNDSYNDRWFFYDPAIPYVPAVFDALDLTHLANKASDATTGEIARDAVNVETTPKNFGEYYVYVDGVVRWVPLKYVANVYATANEWSMLDYSGCMQVIDLTGQLLVLNTPNGVPWTDAINYPRIDMSPDVRQALLNILDEIDSLKNRLNYLTSYSPHVADVVADIAYQVGTVFPMNMDESIPRMKEATFVANTSCYYFSGASNTFVSTGPIRTQTEFDAIRAERGTLYTAVIHD